MKRASRKSKLVVGAFVTFMVLLGLAAVLFFGDDMTMFKHSSRYFATFKSTSGLHVGAPLKMGGVDIGSVEDIAISTIGETPEIKLTLIIYAPHNALIKTDSEASLDTQGMLGDKFLNVTSGSSDAKALPAGSTLKTKESEGMSAIVSQSTAIIKTVGDTTAKLEGFVDSLPNAQLMKDIALDVRSSSKEVTQMLTLVNAKNSPLRTLSDPVVSARVLAVLESLEKASAHLESVAAKVDDGKGTLGALVNDPSLYDDMRKLMGRANRSKTAKYIIQQMMDKPDETAPAAGDGSGK